MYSLKIDELLNGYDKAIEKYSPEELNDIVTEMVKTSGWKVFEAWLDRQVALIMYAQFTDSDIKIDYNKGKFDVLHMVLNIKEILKKEVTL